MLFAVVCHEAEACTKVFLRVKAEFAAEPDVVGCAIKVKGNFVVEFGVCRRCLFDKVFGGMWAFPLAFRWIVGLAFAAFLGGWSLGEFRTS